MLFSLTGTLFLVLVLLSYLIQAFIQSHLLYEVFPDNILKTATFLLLYHAFPMLYGHHLMFKNLPHLIFFFSVAPCTPLLLGAS